MPRATIRLESRVVASAGQVSTGLGQDTVILSAKLGQYFGLDEVGARVWALLREPIVVARLCEAIANEYEVGKAACEEDVLGLLSDLERKGLIDVLAAAE